MESLDVQKQLAFGYGQSRRGYRDEDDVCCVVNRRVAVSGLRIFGYGGSELPDAPKGIWARRIKVFTL